MPITEKTRQSQSLKNLRIPQLQRNSPLKSTSSRQYSMKTIKSFKKPN